MTDTTVCPRCYGTGLVLTVQALLSIDCRGELGENDIDSDSFISLWCANCDITLQGEPGDGRLRLATLYRNNLDAVDHENPLHHPVWHQAMHDAALAIMKKGRR